MASHDWLSREAAEERQEYQRQAAARARAAQRAERQQAERDYQAEQRRLNNTR